MIKYTIDDKTLVIPSGLGFGGQSSGSGGVTPEEAAQIASAVTAEALYEYDTELQVDLEEIREAVSANTGTLLDLSQIAVMTVADRVALFDEIYDKAASGEKVYIKGLVQEETIRTAILPLVSYRPETNPILHQGGYLYFAAKGDTDNIYFHVALSSEGAIDPTSSTFIKRNIYTLPTASSEVKGGVKVGSGLLMTQETLSLDTTGIVTDGDLAPFIVQLSGNTEDISELSGVTGELQGGLSNLETFVQGDLQDAIAEVGGLADSANTKVEALSAVTSALTQTVAGKQDALTAGNGIDLSGSTISVKIGDGLGFSGDTLVVSGGTSSNTKVVMLNDLTEQERVALYNELSSLYDYNANGWTSAYTEDMYAFYLDLRTFQQQDAAQTIDKYEGFFPMQCDRMHPSDYGGAAFFTGVQHSREGNGQLICIRFVITSDGQVDGPSTWINTPSQSPEYNRYLYITTAGTIADDQDWSSISDEEKAGIIRMRYNGSSNGEEAPTLGSLKWWRRYHITYNDEVKWYYVWSADVLIDSTVYTGVWGCMQDEWYTGSNVPPQLISWTSGATITLPYQPLP
jgi:hypothetical protein